MMYSMTDEGVCSRISVEDDLEIINSKLLSS